MKPNEQMLLLDRMDGLIRRKQTGNAKELANRLGISESSVFRLIRETRDKGIQIKYSLSRRSYFYDGETPLHIHFDWDSLDEKK